MFACFLLVNLINLQFFKDKKFYNISLFLKEENIFLGAIMISREVYYQVRGLRLAQSSLWFGSKIVYLSEMIFTVGMINNDIYFRIVQGMLSYNRVINQKLRVDKSV